jgi:hypothetical protein
MEIGSPLNHTPSMTYHDCSSTAGAGGSGGKLRIIQKARIIVIILWWKNVLNIYPAHLSDVFAKVVVYLL